MDVIEHEGITSRRHTNEVLDGLKSGPGAYSEAYAGAIKEN